MSIVAFHFLAAIALAFVAASFLPLIDTYAWWVRMTDFPRLQFGVALVVLAVLLLPFVRLFPKRTATLLLLMGAAVAFHAYVLWPYLPTGTAYRASGCASERSLSVLVANVHLKNEPDGELVRMVRRRRPDLLLTMEIDAGWDRALNVLEDELPYPIQRITGTAFGIHLQSRLPLVSPEIRHLAGQNTPQIVTGVRLRSGEIIQFLGIHPRPPLPSQSALGRDAVLMNAALIARASERSTVLAGDLNATPWEDAVERMQIVAGLVDPREGYGYVPTYDALSWWMAWPLDQVFYQPGFATVSLERLDNFGSDHYAYLVRLCRVPSGQSPAPPAPDPEAVETAEQIMALARKRSSE